MPAKAPLSARTLGLSALGGTLEYYDFIVYVFFAKVIGALFFPEHMSGWLREVQTLGIFAAGYLARPIGGIVFGHFADKLGRKRMFTLTVLLMALPTLLIACLPTYASAGMAAPLLLLCMRVLQGLAVGGELTGAWVFVAEHVPDRRYGLGLGILTAGINGGIVLGSLVAGWIHVHYSAAEIQDYAWRLPFALGGLFGVVSVYLRRYLEETPVFKALQAQARTAREMPLRTVLQEHRPTLAFVAAQTWVLSAAVGVVLLLAPTYLQALYDVSMAQALHVNALATLVAALGCVVVGWASDRVGPSAMMVVGWGGLMVSGYWLLGTHAPAGDMTLRYLVAGFFAGSLALVPIACVRAFPPPIRATGMSFGYNVAYALFGGLTPLLVSLLLHIDARAPAHYLAAACAVGVALAFASRSRYVRASGDLPSPVPAQRSA
ncbi:MFS transporter [Variovorax sp. OV329]|uniref:MFS transporter n=1 Tax=Variovorax sp. OV329 TaxID=1882825 RepID=UPI0008E5A78B|nr:MFS transporter [Variovorax sp. OV329]SFM92231.1 Major Facilitator Superfamily protein [Variovorax sp. OV329]